jgi:hypothetical protein
MSYVAYRKRLVVSVVTTATANNFESTSTANVLSDSDKARAPFRSTIGFLASKMKETTNGSL